MDINPVAGSSSAYPQPNEQDLAQQMRSGIAEFSKSISSGNPDSTDDVESLGKSITNLYTMTSKV